MFEIRAKNNHYNHNKYSSFNSCKAGDGPARLSIQFKTYSKKNNQKLLKIAKLKFRKIIATFM